MEQISGGNVTKAVVNDRFLATLCKTDTDKLEQV